MLVSSISLRAGACPAVLVVDAEVGRGIVWPGHDTFPITLDKAPRWPARLRSHLLRQ